MSIESKIKKNYNYTIKSKVNDEFINDLRVEIISRNKIRSKIKNLSFSFSILLFVFIFLFLKIPINSENYYSFELNNLKENELCSKCEHDIHFESVDYLIDNSDLLVSNIKLISDLSLDYEFMYKDK